MGIYIVLPLLSSLFCTLTRRFLSAGQGVKLSLSLFSDFLSFTHFAVHSLYTSVSYSEEFEMCLFAFFKFMFSVGISEYLIFLCQHPLQKGISRTLPTTVFFNKDKVSSILKNHFCTILQ